MADKPITSATPGLTEEQAVNRIKQIILEDAYPMFSDTDILFYYNENNKSFRATVYNLLKLKAETGSTVITGMTLPNPERFFMRLATPYRPNNSGVL